MRPTGSCYVPSFQKDHWVHLIPPRDASKPIRLSDPVQGLCRRGAVPAVDSDPVKSAPLDVPRSVRAPTDRRLRTSVS